MKTDTMKIFAVSSCLIIFMFKICVSGAQTCAVETKYYCPRSSKKCCWTYKDGQFQAKGDTTNSGKRLANKYKQTTNKTKQTSKQTISKEVS